jgi:hypothetical protein
MGFIALAEIVGAVFGVMPSAFLDGLLPDFDFDADADMHIVHDGAVVPQSAGPLATLLNWLCVGRVPVLILLVAFLSAFGITGWVVQGFAVNALGFPLWTWLAAMPALIVAIPSTRWLGLSLARLLPTEESEAISSRSFIGRIAIVGSASARQGLPAEAKLTDRFGQTHYVRVEPDGDYVFEPGTEVLLVAQNGGVFRAVQNTSAALSRS